MIINAKQYQKVCGRIISLAILIRSMKLVRKSENDPYNKRTMSLTISEHQEVMNYWVDQVIEYVKRHPQPTEAAPVQQRTGAASPDPPHA